MNQELIQAVRTAVAWLDAPQDPAAVITHHGIAHREKIGRYNVGFTPAGYNDLPVFVFTDDRQYDNEWEGMTQEEQQQLLDAVAQVAVISTFWNGVGTNSLSVGLKRKAGEGIMRCLNNYRKAGHAIFSDGWWSSVKPATRPEGWA